jgi:import inner membrane translocase subunit TIM21
MSFYASRIVVKELITLPTRALKGRALVAIRCSRCYATRRDTPPHVQSGVGPSSLLSQALDQKQRGSRREDSVGPFQLGLSQSSFGEGTTKRWSELSPKGKGQFLNFIITLFENLPLSISAVRATARTTNLTVILFGAGLTTVLIYALTSELFSRNSPTVLYSEACERIKSSQRVCNPAARLAYILKRIRCRSRNIYQDY